MPKLRMNSFIGLRTTWSLKNEVTWKKSQRFGGITFILAGFLIILVCIFTRDIQCALWTMLIFIMTLIADVLYSYKISLKYQQLEFYQNLSLKLAMDIARIFHVTVEELFEFID